MTQQEAIEAAKKYPQIKWVAMDEDGDWYGYAHKPIDGDYVWIYEDGDFIELKPEKEKNENWRTSLHEITNTDNN